MTFRVCHCHAQATIEDAKTVTTEGTRRKGDQSLPLFSLELLATDGEAGGIAFSPAAQPESYPEAVLVAFDAALVSTGTIQQVEHQVVPHLLKNSTACLQTVSNTEPACKQSRDRIEATCTKWVPVAHEYLATFDKYVPFVTKPIEAMVEELSTEETTLNMIKKELMYHLERVDVVKDELPKAMSLGLFQVSTAQVRDFLSTKHKDCVAALQKLVSDTALAKCTKLCDEFKRDVVTRVAGHRAIEIDERLQQRRHRRRAVVLR